MDWEWWSNEPSRLATMVVPDLYEGHRDLIPPAILSLRATADMRATVCALYDCFRAKGLHYDLDPTLARVEQQIRVQKIRQPQEVFGGGRGTCIDLALIFCGMCENARLRPFLTLLKLRGRQERHALVIIGPSFRDDLHDRTDADLRADKGERVGMPCGVPEVGHRS